MRILIVTQYFWPESFRINDLATGLAERGHQVTVLTGKPNYPGGRFFPGYGLLGRAREAYGAVAVRRVPLLPRGRGGGLALALNYASFALTGSVFGPLRCRGGYDAILVYEPSPVTVGLPALALKRAKRAPVLFWVQDLWPESLSATGAVRSRQALRVVERLVRFIYRGCERILVQSLAFRDPIRRLGVPEDRILYFPNSAEDLYQPVEPGQAPVPVPLPEGFRVMFAGNVGAAQAFETILSAAERLLPVPGVHWLVLGEGRLSPWVREQVARRGLAERVHLLGRYPPESMPGWFAHADAMLVSLRADPIFALTIPAKVQSYMACAKPIVAALDGEGARVVAEAGAGLVAGADDPRSLAEAVLAMSKMSPADRRAMGGRGRQYFEAHFERGKLLDRLEGWLEGVVRDGREGSACAS